MDVVMELVFWLSHYRALFSSKCAYCNKILVADTCAQEGGKSHTHTHTHTHTHMLARACDSLSPCFVSKSCSFH